MDVELITPFFKGIPYHSTYSGYERLADFVNPVKIYHTILFRRSPFLFPLRILRLIPRSYASLEAEIAALRGSATILHHLYGEDTFLISGFSSLQKKRRIVVTFHKPPEYFKKVMPIYWRRTFRTINGLIVLSPSQYYFFKENVNTNLINLVPHGIDIDFFTPPTDGARDRFLFLTVGNHLRDYPTLLRALKIVRTEIPNLRLIAISNKITKLPKNVNVIVKGHVSDLQLLELYRRASFLVLPLEQTTASNVLLESMACGLPVICTKLDDVMFYTANQGCLYYEKGNERELADRIVYLATSEEARNSLGLMARKRAEELSWNRIARMTKKVYQNATNNLS